ncbi:aspartate/glutamate racemase family protein [Streptomyces sp. NPDC085540]|uniref:aspartate/glutamate racemase family protein n=1 Tax=Streptomyces sp. NPDC085540 TaxID=3365730 RepID=UPI0037D463EC
MSAVSQQLVGVVGGMGPLASTELLRTVYEQGTWTVEQDAPRVLLWSDPAVVDRTDAIGSNGVGRLREAVERSVRGLAAAGAHRIVIACLTAHHVMDALPADLAERCVSLVDIVFDELERASRPHLLLCTSGTAQAGIFTAHPRHPAVRERLVPLAADDQRTLHELVYRIKRGDDPARGVDFLRETLPRYGVRAFVAACTELHLVTREIAASGLADEFPSIDPLTIAAERIRNGVL